MRTEFSKQTCSISGCGKATVGRKMCRRHYNRWWKYGDPIQVGPSKGDLERWLRANALYQEDSCLIWPFHKTKNGIAQCTFEGKHVNAARAMCIIAHGSPPSPVHDAAHSCGRANDSCVNPRHLRWATKKENAADRIIHGTALLGSKNPQARLSDEDVRIIRSKEGVNTHAEIAQKFGICRQHVGNILSGKRWDWL